jgi:hypothetical protein
MDVKETLSSKGDGKAPSTPSEGEIPDIEHVLAEESPRVIDHKAERALVWKFDLRLLPVLAVMVSIRYSKDHNPSGHQLMLSAVPLQRPGQEQSWKCQNRRPRAKSWIGRQPM